MKWLFLLMCVSGCGVGQPSSGVVLQLHFPAALGRMESRRLELARRAVKLVVVLKSREGETARLEVAPADWSQIALPPLDFPKSASDALDVHVQVWDTDRQGLARKVPSLSAKAKLKADEMAQSGPTALHMGLVLRVPVSEYDST